MSDYKKPPLVKSGRWSADEQRKFLIGLRKYGKGSWKVSMMESLHWFKEVIAWVERSCAYTLLTRESAHE